MLTLIKRIPTGRELTYAEVDGNWQDIEDAVNAVASGNGLPPYNAGFTYLGGVQYIVSYAGAIYTFISAGDVTGTTPGTNPAIWQLTNAGSLLHQQGTDLFVGYGSAFETSAEQLFNLANVRVITEAAFIVLYNNNTLKPNTVYAVTGCALTSDANDLPILYIKALSNSVVDSVCAMTLRMPDFSQDLFVLTKWNATATYLAGAKVCIDGLVYTNLTGNNTTTLPASDPTNWNFEFQSTSYYINKKYGNVQIKITNVIEVDFFTDLATNTVYSAGTDLSSKYLDSTANIAYSQSRSINCSLGKLNRLLSGNCNYVILDGDNCVISVPVGGNSFFQNVMLIDSEIDLGNFFAYGNIQNVHLKHVALLFPDGCDNGVSGLTIDFNYFAQIRIPNPIGFVIGGTVNNKGSDVEFSGVLPNLTTLNLDTVCNGYSDVFGVFKLSTNSPNVDTIVRACRLFPIKIMPSGGNIFILVKTTPASATAGKILSDVDVTLNSGRADYAILTPVTIDVGGGPIDVWQITEYKNNL